MTNRLLPALLLCALAPAAHAASAPAAPPPPPPVACEPQGGFPAWRENFHRHAVAEGVSRRTASAALDGLTPNRQVVALDRDQRAFKADFEQWVRERINPRLPKARRLLAQHKDLLGRIERQYGVPGPILVAIWGMETDFGAVTGNLRVIRSLATLAHDC